METSLQFEGDSRNIRKFPIAVKHDGPYEGS